MLIDQRERNWMDGKRVTLDGRPGEVKSVIEHIVEIDGEREKCARVVVKLDETDEEGDPLIVNVASHHIEVMD